MTCEMTLQLSKRAQLWVSENIVKTHYLLLVPRHRILIQYIERRRREVLWWDTTAVGCLAPARRATPCLHEPSSWDERWKEFMDSYVSVASSSIRIHSRHGALLNPITSFVVQVTSNPKDNIKYLFAVALTTAALLRLHRNLFFPRLTLSGRVKLCLRAKSRKRSDWIAGNLCALWG